MISLQEWNTRCMAAVAERANGRGSGPPPDFSGVACPQCGGELRDPKGSFLVFDSLPQYRYAKCSACGYICKRAMY